MEETGKDMLPSFSSVKPVHMTVLVLLFIINTMGLV